MYKQYGVLSHYVKYIFCENSDVRGFIWSSSALHNFLRSPLAQTDMYFVTFGSCNPT